MLLDIVYIASRYPALVQTYVAREVQQLAALGHRITICNLKGPGRDASSKGLVVEDAFVFPAQRNPLRLIEGLVWAVRNRPAETLEACRDVLDAAGHPVSLVKLAGVLLLTCRLAQLLNGRRPVHIRAHFLHGEAVSAMWLGRLLGVPYSLTAHTATILLHRLVIARAVQGACFVIGDTSETKQLLEELRGTSDDDVHLIRNGIPLDQFRYRASQHIRGTPLILAIGALIEKKGFDVLVRACGLLRDWHVPYRCEIVGDGPEQGRLTALIAQLGLSQQVHLLGSLPFSELLPVYDRATVFVMPSVNPTRSSRDGLPTVLIEAMAQGIPVVASDFAAIPDLVRNGETGLLVPPGNAVELANAIKRLLEDPSLCSSLARAGRSKIEREYDIEKSVKHLERLIMHTFVFDSR